MAVFMKRFLAAAACILAFLPHEGRAGTPDWSRAAQTKTVLFYPGVTSWDFLTSDDHRLGGREIKLTRKDCRHCHLSKDGELDLKADEIASGSVRMKRSHNPFEPEPMAGKKGLLNATISAAFDDEFLYLRISWDSRGAGWLGKTGETPDRVSVQVNKSEPAFAKYGCFITCHNDLNTMPASPTKAQVESDPYYRSRKRDDVRLYAYYAKNSWSARPDQKALKDGGRIDLWSMELINGKHISSEGFIFDDRTLVDKPGLADAGDYTNGRYTAVFKRRLKSADSHGVSIAPGDVVSIGVAIHDEGASKRKHFVSFPMTVGLGTGADIRAERVR